jgi:phenylpropionate dioxygenase-like ring-hydroxylating dioxygenase large terminal subunit
LVWAGGEEARVNDAVSTYRPVDPQDLAWLGTGPIPARPYYDPEWFELEREAVFKRTWLQVGHVCELPGPASFIVRPVEVAGASVLIVRGKDDVIRAFHNVCTHRGTELVAAKQGKAAAFTCRYHAWTFGYDGALRSAPDFERFYVAKADCGLKPVAADVCGGLIFVNFAPRPSEGLRDFLGPIAEQLDGLTPSRATTFSEYVYEIEANWKLAYDNFQENYHLRFIHPKTGGATIGPDNPMGYPTSYSFYGPHRGQTLWKNPDPPPPPPTLAFTYGKAAALAAADGAPNGKVDFKVFPNLFLIGQTAWFFSHVMMPLSATRTRGVIRLYWVGEDGDATRRFVREHLMASVRDLHAEDRAIIEAGQKGLGSGALEHINFQLHESLCRHLHACVDERVQAYRAEQRRNTASG